MVFEIGVNLRVTECLDKGDRNYMEDFSKCYFEKVDGSIVFGFFGIFDGHGGSEAACFAKKHLINEIKSIPLFWSEDDDDVLSAIKQGFLSTHRLMWNEREKWTKTVSGFDSTAGTTATIAIVRNRKLYIGHVGDSACVLGSSKMMMARTDTWEPVCLTVDHKPTNLAEKKRIEKYGGSLAKKSGVERVVWRRPKLSNPRKDLVVGDSIEYEQIPFLAVTRSLGDLWSYDKIQGVFHISPEPDVQCLSLDSLEHRCLILGSDGLWNVVSIQAAIEIVRICERETERRVFLDPNINSNFFYNPAASLVKHSIGQWKRRRIRADNVSALVIMIDPPGPSMTKRREDRRKSNFSALDILSSLTCDVPSYENFSKQLSKEFLIECCRWRSANETKSEINFEQSVALNSTRPQTIENETNDSYCLSTSTVYQNSPTNTVKPSQGVTKSSETSNGKYSDCIPEKAITSDSFYLKYCLLWVNDTKVWNFLSDYFKSKGLTNESEILHYLNTIDPSLSGEVLRIMPWIVTARTSFKFNSLLRLSIRSVPIFSNFWIELYIKHIKPLEKSCLTIQLTNMQAIISILKPHISSLLKQYNYLVSSPLTEIPTVQYKNEEINENNETRTKKMKSKSVSVDLIIKNKKPFSVFKISDHPKLNFLLKNKYRDTKISRFVQSDKKGILKKEPFPLKRSVSDKILGDKKSFLKSKSTQYGNSLGTNVPHRRSDSSSTYQCRQRYSTINTSNVNNMKSDFLILPNLNGTFTTKNYKFNLDLEQAVQNNQNNAITGPLRSASDNSRSHIYRQFCKRYKENLTKSLLSNFK